MIYGTAEPAIARGKPMNETAEFSPFPGSHRLADLARRVPHAAWPFIVLAALQTLLLVSLGYRDFRNIAIWVIPTLLPVAVIVGRRDAWKSARMVMIGAILWGSALAVAQVFAMAWPQIGGNVEMDTPADFVLRVGVRGASLLAIAGPALVMLGLRTRRETQTSWPRALVAVAVVVTAALCVWNVKQALDSQALQDNYGYYIDISLRDRLDAIAQGLEALDLLTMGALAWSAVSAVRAQEEPRRFWLAIGAGSSLLFATDLYWRLALPGAGGAMGPLDWLSASLSAAIAEIRILAVLAGFVLLLIGFGLGLPDSDEELLGDVLPERAADPA
jgi:hypothetical protein